MFLTVHRLIQFLKKLIRFNFNKFHKKNPYLQHFYLTYKHILKKPYHRWKVQQGVGGSHHRRRERQPTARCRRRLELQGLPRGGGLLPSGHHPRRCRFRRPQKVNGFWIFPARLLEVHCRTRFVVSKKIVFLSSKNVTNKKQKQ